MQPTHMGLMVGTFTLMSLAAGAVAQEKTKVDTDNRSEKYSTDGLIALLKNAPKAHRRVVTVGIPQGGKGPGLPGRKEDEIVASAARPSDAVWDQGVRIFELIYKNGPIDPFDRAGIPARSLTMKVSDIEIRIPIYGGKRPGGEPPFNLMAETGKLVELINEANKGKPSP